MHTPGELNETEAPGRSEDAILFASDSFDDLTYDGLADGDQQTVQKGTSQVTTHEWIHLYFYCTVYLCMCQCGCVCVCTFMHVC